MAVVGYLYTGSKISVGVHVTEPKSGMTALDALRVNGHLMNRDNDKKMQVVRAQIPYPKSRKRPSS